MTIEKSLRLYFKGVKIDDRTEDYISKKIDAIGKLLDKVTRVEVEIDIDKKKNEFRVEVMIKTPYKLYRAEESTESIEGSIDVVENEIKEQINKDKGKIKTLKMRGRRSIKKKTVLDKDARF
jgi:ribosomal subunit interface protein